MLRKKVKRTVATAARSAGVFRLLADSRWRSSRLLILGYHGIALEDEYKWDDSLYLSPERFRSRMAAIKRTNCTVLDLQQGLDMLATGTLPPRAVVLTFDDGTYDFYRIACPILKEFGYRATLYLTTYYVRREFPVAPVAWRYMMWKRQGSMVDASTVVGKSLMFDLRTREGRDEASSRMWNAAEERGFNGEQRNEMSAQLAELLDFDYEEFRRKRILQLLRPAEVKAVAAQGISVQLHTHRHRSASDRQTYLRELDENRQHISDIVGNEPRHFCYPNGNHKPEYVGWLREAGVISATTCNVGLTDQATERLLLPRLVDTSSLSDAEFEGWLTGFEELLPHRSRRRSA
jgi:peptidoglycan/xylan/chitin deacetylase (PgdA/CDA1 family)